MREDFEGTSASDWTYNGEWAVGTPSASGEPALAHSGTQCAGTVIGGEYSNNQDFETCSLVSPPVDLTDLTHPILTFYQFVNTEDGYDGGALWVSADGGASWDFVDDSLIDPDYNGDAGGTPAFMGDQSSSGWQQVTVDLSAYAGETILIRFGFHSDSSVTHAGWYIDDVLVTEQ